jgi:hypothetical protein
MCITQSAANISGVAKPASKHLSTKTEKSTTLQPWQHLKMKTNVYQILYVVYW